MIDERTAQRMLAQQKLTNRLLMAVVWMIYHYGAKTKTGSKHEHIARLANTGNNAQKQFDRTMDNDQAFEKVNGLGAQNA